MSVNLHSLAFMIRDDVTTVKCHFGSHTGYTYKVTRELAETLEPGDIVLVENDQATVKWATVDAIHDEPQLDPEDGITYKWAFQKIDFPALVDLKADERLIVDRLQARRKASHRQQALAALGITDTDAFMRELKAPAEES